MVGCISTFKEEGEEERHVICKWTYTILNNNILLPNYSQIWEPTINLSPNVSIVSDV